MRAWRKPRRVRRVGVADARTTWVIGPLVVNRLELRAWRLRKPRVTFMAHLGGRWHVHRSDADSSDALDEFDLGRRDTVLTLRRAAPSWFLIRVVTPRAENEPR